MILGAGSPSETVLHHIQDGNELDFFGKHVAIPDFLLSIGVTKFVLYQWFCALVVVWFFSWVAKRRTAGVPTGIYNAVEALLLGLKADIGDKLLTEKDSPKWMPYLWTAFFFIFVNNAFGLIPMGATATGHLKVTATLAICTFVLVHAVAARHGIKGYFHAIVPSVPWWIWPMLLVLEQVGYAAKTVALAVRLFANMVAGHLVFLTIISFCLMFSWKVAPIVIPAAVGLYVMEIFVAILQAYIFTFLTAVFIGGVLHPDH